MPEFYQFNEAGNMKESAPTRCLNGHPLGPNTVLVGALPCLCHPPATVHRTWRCTAQQETLSEGSNANPAAREAIDQRAREAAADLELAAAAFRAERYQAKPEG